MTTTSLNVLRLLLCSLVLTAPMQGYAKQPILIDAGHGDSDQGVQGCDGLQESRLTLEYAQRLQELADGKRGLPPLQLLRGQQTMMPWQERAAAANALQPRLLLSLHAENAPQAASPQGVRIYSLELAEAPSPAQTLLTGEWRRLTDLAQRHRAAGERLAAQLYTAIKQALPEQQVYWQHGAYLPLLGVDAPAVMVGVGFLAPTGNVNQGDCQRLRDARQRDLLLEALLEGLKLFQRRS